MKLIKIKGFINRIEVTFKIEDARGHEDKINVEFQCDIDLNKIDFSKYDIFLDKSYFNESLGDLLSSRSPFFSNYLYGKFQDIISDLLLENKDKVYEYLYAHEYLYDGEDILEIYDIEIVDYKTDMPVIEAELVKIKSAKVNVKGSITRSRYEVVKYQEYEPPTCDCYYPCDCKGYYYNDIDKTLIKNVEFSAPSTVLWDIDISDIKINKESLIKKLKEAYRKDIHDTYDSEYVGGDGILYENETTAYIDELTIISMDIERSILSSDIHKVAIEF